MSIEIKNCHRGKKYLVTGAARGIGKAVLAELHSLGAKVYALARNPEKLRALENEFPGVTRISVDLADWDATQNAIADLPAMDGLINNAGLYSYTDFLLNVSSESLDQLFDVNVKGLINVSQVVAKKMIENGKSGGIVNVASISGQRPFPGEIVYGTSKAAVLHLTKAMALELGPHKITVNAVCPAMVGTDMSKEFEIKTAMESDQNEKSADELFQIEAYNKLMDRFQQRGELTPTRTAWMPMEEVVKAILFFCSDSTQITGSSISVDGGFVIC